MNSRGWMRSSSTNTDSGPESAGRAVARDPHLHLPPLPESTHHSLPVLPLNSPDNTPIQAKPLSTFSTVAPEVPGRWGGGENPCRCQAGCLQTRNHTPGPILTTTKHPTVSRVSLPSPHKSLPPTPLPPPCYEADPQGSREAMRGEGRTSPISHHCFLPPTCV